MSAPLNLLSRNSKEVNGIMWRYHISGALISRGDLTSVEISPHMEISPKWSSHLTLISHLTWSSHLTWRFHLTCRSRLTWSFTSVEISPHTPQFAQIGKNTEGQGAGSFRPPTQHVPQPTVRNTPLLVNAVLIPTPHFIKVPQ